MRGRKPLQTRSKNGGEGGDVQKSLIETPYSLSTLNKGEFIINKTKLQGINYSEDINDDSWHYLTGTFNGTEMRLYVDGVLTANHSNYNGEIPKSSGSLYIGKSHTTYESVNFFNGSIDEIRVWNRSLSSVEIVAQGGGERERRYAVVGES